MAVLGAHQLFSPLQRPLWKDPGLLYGVLDFLQVFKGVSEVSPLMIVISQLDAGSS